MKEHIEGTINHSWKTEFEKVGLNEKILIPYIYSIFNFEALRNSNLAISKLMHNWLF